MTRHHDNDNRVAAVDTTVVTADQAIEQGTQPWTLRVIANRHTRLANERGLPRAIANQRRTVAERLRAVAKEVARRVAT